MSGDSIFMTAIKELIDNERFGVLGSYMEGQPYSNLVAFMPYNDYHSLIFVTPRTTRKYVNLKKHPSSSMLIDSRQGKLADYLDARGVSACGVAYELEPGRETDKIIKLYLKKHPAMEEFVNSPTTAIFELKVNTYYFVENFQEVTEIHLHK
jgi:nitroimidazol reductase NimA-like FMN-containing flavoprotein (pyridoxamine 5'-phosphate oxidase superfamily)